MSYANVTCIVTNIINLCGGPPRPAAVVAPRPHTNPGPASFINADWLPRESRARPRNSRSSRYYNIVRGPRVPPATTRRGPPFPPGTPHAAGPFSVAGRPRRGIRRAGSPRRPRPVAVDLRINKMTAHPTFAVSVREPSRFRYRSKSEMRTIERLQCVPECETTARGSHG